MKKIIHQTLNSPKTTFVCAIFLMLYAVGSILSGGNAASQSANPPAALQATPQAPSQSAAQTLPPAPTQATAQTPTPAPSRVLHVPGDYPTLQDAINDGQNGDQIIYSGNSLGSIDTQGKRILLKFETPAPVATAPNASTSAAPPATAANAPDATLPNTATPTATPTPVATATPAIPSSVTINNNYPATFEPIVVDGTEYSPNQDNSVTTPYYDYSMPSGSNGYYNYTAPVIYPNGYAYPSYYSDEYSYYPSQYASSIPTYYGSSFYSYPTFIPRYGQGRRFIADRDRNRFHHPQFPVRRPIGSGTHGSFVPPTHFQPPPARWNPPTSRVQNPVVRSQAPIVRSQAPSARSFVAPTRSSGSISSGRSFGSGGAMRR